MIIIKYNIGDKVYARKDEGVKAVFHLRKGIIEEIIIKGNGVYCRLKGEVHLHRQELVFKTLDEAVENLKENFEEIHTTEALITTSCHDRWHIVDM